MTSPAASAANLVIDGNGELKGATGVTVGASTYDVEFVEGTCAGVFGQCQISSFNFTSEAAALVAGQALLSQVITGIYDANPALTFGCSNDLVCRMLIPYGFANNPTFFQTLSPANGTASNSLTSYFASEATSYDSIDASQEVWARFTLSSSGVPEPATWAMMLLGFGSIGVAMRRRQRTTQLPQVA